MQSRWTSRNGSSRRRGRGSRSRQPVLLLGMLLSLLLQLPGQAEAKSRWGADYFPDVFLTTHTGEKVHFYRDLLKGKVVAINFMFTSCENVCPAETARLRQVQDLLGDRLGSDVHMYSISIDPEVDTPEALALYRKRFDVGAGWTFLTAPREVTDLIQRKLGLLVDKLEDPKDHNASLVLGNEETGQWIKRTPYDDPNQLAHLLAESLSNWKGKPRAKRDYASYSEAPGRENWGTGERLFRTRCESCHTIGSGPGLGPDLAGITERRERPWLARWITDPDEMVKEGDPVAMQLVRDWPGIRMPNLGLETTEAEAILAFIESVKTTPAPEPPEGAPSSDAHAHHH